MKLLITVALLLSTSLAALPFFAKLRRRKIPDTVDFAALSFLLYYVLGILLESLGFAYKSPYFASFFEARPEILVKAVFLLFVAPWLFRAGSLIGRRGASPLPQEPLTAIGTLRRPVFYGLIFSVTLVLILFEVHKVLAGVPLWLRREAIGIVWGPWIVALYLPLHFLAFYVRQANSRRMPGPLVSFGLAGAAIFLTAGIGQRTNVLLPILIVFLFGTRLTSRRLVALAAVSVITAGVLLPLFKWQYAFERFSKRDLVIQSIHYDFSRNTILAKTLEMTEPDEKRVVPYPLAGYVYGALFFVPRQLVPFKGYSTQSYFTSAMTGTRPEDLRWGFGTGVIEELVLNVGFWLAVPGFLVYGFVLGLVDRLSRRVPSIVVPSRLAALWLGGYHLPAILLLFGSMGAVAWALHAAFTVSAGETARIADA